MTIRWLHVAEEELAEAQAFYNSRSEAAARSFVARVTEATIQIVRLPASGRLVCRHIRRKLVSSFPYALLYRSEPDEIVIVAVMHLSRDPDYWKDRI
jgi:plasmid stabilization system protein ParE